MAKVLCAIMAGGGRNAKGDAQISQVLNGVSFSNKDSNELVGSMPNRGNWNAWVNADTNVTIPVGYHAGGGHVYGNSLDSQLATIQSRYSISAGNIKKGVTIAGVTGTFEGWVPGSSDVYKLGAFGSGYNKNYINLYSTQLINDATANIYYEQSQIRTTVSTLDGKPMNESFNPKAGLRIGNFNFSRFSTIYIDALYNMHISDDRMYLYIYDTAGTQIKYFDITSNGYGQVRTQKSMSILDINVEGYVVIELVKSHGMTGGTSYSGYLYQFSIY